MPPRPALLPPPSLAQAATRPRPQWICHSCQRRIVHTSRPRPRPRLRLRLRPEHPAATTPSTPRVSTTRFHASSRQSAESKQTHYETLQLPPSASPADIKRQFYTLSKQHHPDRNPSDPDASSRFVAISEAYHVLSVPEKRAKYDAEISSSSPASRWGGGMAGRDNAAPRGSYSSAGAASYAGSRPASGLNKKRSTFRGPPPSFYKSGGYGPHGAKRAEYAYSDPHPHSSSSASSSQNQTDAGRESYGDFGGGFGPGQTRQGSQVPHFDDRRHKSMHDHVNEHIYARRRRNAAARAREVREEQMAEGGKGDMIVRFLVVSGVLVLVGLTAKVFGDAAEERERIGAGSRSNKRKNGP